MVLWACSCNPISGTIPTDLPDSTSILTPSEDQKLTAVLSPVPTSPTPSVCPDTTGLPSNAPKPPNITTTPTESPDISTQPSETPAPLPSSGAGNPTDGPDETRNIAGMFSFGMSWGEISDVLFPNGYQDGDIEGHGFTSVWDNWAGSWMDVTAWGYDGYAYGFFLNGSDTLYQFYSPDVSTARGLTPGDNVARMIELYGNDCIRHDQIYRNEYTGISTCEYDFGEYYLSFNVDGDTGIIKSWEVSRFSYDEQMWATEQNENHLDE